MTSEDPRSTTPRPAHDKLDSPEDHSDNAPQLISYARVLGRIPGDIRDQITALAALDSNPEKVPETVLRAARKRSSSRG